MLIAGLGGFAGTCGRYLTGVAGKKLFGDKYPAGTFAVNVIGCFIIGIFVGLWTRHDMSPLVNALLISGFCGGFTTFSSFSHDSFAMIQKRTMVEIYLLHRSIRSPRSSDGMARHQMCGLIFHLPQL